MWIRSQNLYVIFNCELFFVKKYEKEFGFKLLPTSFKKPLSEITKEEYRERIEYLYNAIINDDSNEGD